MKFGLSICREGCRNPLRACFEQLASKWEPEIFLLLPSFAHKQDRVHPTAVVLQFLKNKTTKADFIVTLREGFGRC
jgi:hypothetical protein